MKKILAAVMAAVLCAALVSADDTGDKSTDPAAYVLVECSTGTVLDECNSHERRNAGYLGKLMSLLLIAEDIEGGKYGTADILTASDTVNGTKGSVVWLESGDRMSVEELLKSVIVGNANDAMTVLAEKSAGTVEKFTERMNERAAELGMNDTHFCSPYGYFNEEEFTTCADLAVVCAELSGRDCLKEYFCIWRDFVKEGKTELVNEDTLARTYDRHCGFKACHSDESGYCAAECGTDENGLKYAAVVLGAESGEISFSTAKNLIKKGFSDYRVTASFFPQDLLKPVSLRNGEENAVEIGLAETSDIVIPRGEHSFRTVFVLPDFLDAPVHCGQKIGTAAFFNGKKMVFESDVIVKDDVEKLSFGFILREILLNISK